MTNTLVIEGVSKRYGQVRALDDVRLEIAPGVFGLLGPNGAGKTTLMKILASILNADSGSARLGDVRWSNPRDVRRILGYLPQKFDFFRHLTVQESLEYIANMKDIPKAEIKGQVERVLELTNMTEYRARKNKTLSGGMLRRLGVAQAILGNPKLLIVDEPTAGLDPSERIQFRNVITDIALQDTIVLLSTHIVEEIEIMCGQMAILQKGKVLVSATPGEVAAAAEGHVALTDVSQKDFADISKKYPVVSYTVTKDGVHVRYITDADAGASSASPTLEDAYLYLTRKGTKSDA